VTRFLWASYVTLWLLVAILTFLVLLLYRQYGRSILPAKERLGLAGLDIGAKVGPLPVSDASGMATDIPLTTASSRASLQVLLLAASSCPICSQLWGEVGVLAQQRPDVEYWWVQAGEAKDGPAPEGWQFALDTGGSVQRAMEVPALPYAYAWTPLGQSGPRAS